MAQARSAPSLAGILAVFWLSITPAFGQDAMALQVTPSVSASEPIAMSLETLDALDQTQFTTTTIWTDGEISFSGVPLKALLEHLGADGTTLEMVALNDYAVSMPIAELEDDAPLIATRMNGEIMSVRDKGPYWVVFPYDQDPRYRSETNYGRSIWQLNRLKVVD
ncbi:MAG: molybdopterin-dependent oxidoreductase [Albidovulum sp.]